MIETLARVALVALAVLLCPWHTGVAGAAEPATRVGVVVSLSDDLTVDGATQEVVSSNTPDSVAATTTGVSGSQIGRTTAQNSYRADFARPPPTEDGRYAYDTPTNLLDPAAEQSRVLRAVLGLGVLPYAPLGKAKQTELDFANIVAGRGYDVTVRGTSASGADLLIGGVGYELKTLTRATQTSVIRNVQRGLSQSDRVIINGAPSGLSHADAMVALARLKGAGHLSGATEVVIESATGRIVWTP